jgi:hypothetical protein
MRSVIFVLADDRKVALFLAFHRGCLMHFDTLTGGSLKLVGASNWHPARPHLKNMAVCAPLKTGTSTGSLCPSSNKPAASGFRNLSFSKKKGKKR